MSLWRRGAYLTWRISKTKRKEPGWFWPQVGSETLLILLGVFAFIMWWAYRQKVMTPQQLEKQRQWVIKKPA